MKTLLLTYKFTFMTFMTLPLALCSSDNDSESEVPFETVTLLLRDLNLDINDTSFTKDGYSFTCYRAESANIGTELEGVGLWSPDQDANFSSMQLDLSNSTGISQISISLFNNCSSCLDIQLLNGNEIITEVKGTELSSGENLVKIDVSSEISALKIASLETIVYSIKLE